jgi:hypothetical protein
VPDGGRFPLATHSRDSPADGTIFPVPHTSSLLADFPWFCHGLLSAGVFADDSGQPLRSMGIRKLHIPNNGINDAKNQCLCGC